jgi:DNA mismatch repair protein MutH
MYVPQIVEVKEHLEKLKNAGLIREWELPYENLLTRRSAAIFFITPAAEDDARLQQVWEELERYDNFGYRVNEEKKLSQLHYRVTFNPEEAAENRKKAQEATV